MIALLGGSFGIVYKAIEVSTGDVVAIKHVSNNVLRKSMRTDY